MMGPTEQMKMGEFQVVNHLLYNHPRRTAVADGCLDPRLGVSDQVSTCKTCGGDLDSCPGHWAFIKLELRALLYELAALKTVVNVGEECSRMATKTRVLRCVKTPVEYIYGE